MSRRRLDLELVRRGLARSRGQAAEMIAAGGVRVADLTQPKASSLVDQATPIELAAPPPRYVSRGGLKLERALSAFGVTVEGRRVLDAGASTGGFTDCLLQHGARLVVAVDVGYGQLDERLRVDPRVEVHDRTNIRLVEPSDLGGTFELIVADLSFISLCTVAPSLAALTADGGDLVLLVKPQFEVGRRNVGKGGVVTDPDQHDRATRQVAGCLEENGISVRGVIDSPIRGARGNREFLMWGVKGETATRRAAP